MEALPKSQLAIFYHFYPHYRAGVIEAILNDRRWEVTFYGDAKGIDGINEYDFRGSPNFRRIKTTWLGKFVIQPGLVRACAFDEFECAVFLADPNHLTTWVGALICRLRSRRVVFWGHGFRNSRVSLKNRVRRAFFGLAHGFFSYGYRAKTAAIEMGFDACDVHVGFNSLNYRSQRAMRDLCAGGNASGTSAGLQVLCISRLTTSCRYEILFHAVAEIKRRGRVPPSVTVIGDGPEKQRLMSLACTLGVDANFLGGIYDETVIAQKIYNADVTVSPGKVGLTAMHSLMYGTPVISHDSHESQMPEVEAIVSGYTGELFVEGSVEDLVDKLLALEARYPNRNLTRERCYKMIDEVYNPQMQVEILYRAATGLPATRGDEAFRLFERDEK